MNEYYDREAFENYFGQDENNASFIGVFANTLASNYPDKYTDGSYNLVERYLRYEKEPALFADNPLPLADQVVGALKASRRPIAAAPAAAPRDVVNENLGEGNFEPASRQEISILKPVSTVVMGAGIAALLFNVLRG